MVSSVIKNIPVISSSTDLSEKIVQEWRKYKEENITEDFYVSERGLKDDGTSCVNYYRLTSTDIRYCKPLIYKDSQSVNHYL